MAIMNKKEVEQMCQDIADSLNECLKYMTDEGAQQFLDGVSESFFRLGDNRADH
jgi:hypothetical protein